MRVCVRACVRACVCVCVIECVRDASMFFFDGNLVKSCKLLLKSVLLA